MAHQPKTEITRLSHSPDSETSLSASLAPSSRERPNVERSALEIEEMLEKREALVIAITGHDGAERSVGQCTGGLIMIIACAVLGIPLIVMIVWDSTIGPAAVGSTLSWLIPVVSFIIGLLVGAGSLFLVIWIQKRYLAKAEANWKDLAELLTQEYPAAAKVLGGNAVPKDRDAAWDLVRALEDHYLPKKVKVHVISSPAKLWNYEFKLFFDGQFLGRGERTRYFDEVMDTVTGSHHLKLMRGDKEIFTKLIDLKKEGECEVELKPGLTVWSSEVVYLHVAGTLR